MNRIIFAAFALTLAGPAYAGTPEWCGIDTHNVMSFSQDGALMTLKSSDGTEAWFIPLPRPADIETLPDEPPLESMDIETLWKEQRPIPYGHEVYFPCGFSPSAAAIESELGEDQL